MRSWEARARALSFQVVGVGAGAALDAGYPSATGGGQERLPGGGVEVEDAGGDVVDEGAVMTGQQDGSLPTVEGLGEEGDRPVVQVIGRLIQDERGGAGDQSSGQSEAAALAGRQGRRLARARRGLGKASEPETGEHRGDADVQVPCICRGHGGEELVVIAGESVVVGARGQSCGDRLEARGHGSQGRGNGIEVVADVAGAGQDVGNGSDGRGPERAGVGNEVTRDRSSGARRGAIGCAHRGSSPALADALRPHHRPRADAERSRAPRRARRVVVIAAIPQ